ncbi:MAG: alpha/beta hydrolase-fold protein [Candidatus Ozemobacteraceae bacterium]
MNKVEFLLNVPIDTNMEKGVFVSGDIRFHTDFSSKILKNERTIVVYLPPEYKKNSSEAFPVLYMHDGQNIFDTNNGSSGLYWQADETVEKLVRQKKILPLIIVGIYCNENRVDEFLPIFEKTRNKGGNAQRYAEFVVNEVKPFIDKEYRTKPERENSGICGSSFGGLVSLYICLKFPQVFSKCVAMSPGLWPGESWIIRETEKHPEWLRGIKFWIDMGTEEGIDVKELSDGIDRIRELERVFLENDLQKNRDFFSLEVCGGKHNEKNWGDRFGKVLMFLYANF